MPADAFVNVSRVLTWSANISPSLLPCPSTKIQIIILFFGKPSLHFELHAIYTETFCAIYSTLDRQTSQCRATGASTTGETGLMKTDEIALLTWHIPTSLPRLTLTPSPW